VTASLSVCLITRNEEANLERCLTTIADLAAQMVVVDSGSVDRTIEIARRFGAEVLEHPLDDFAAQKQRAFDRARCDWVLGLDADEWLSPELRASLRRVLEAPSERPADGYEVDRRAFVFGAWIRHGGWAPEWKLRLVRKGRGRWSGSPHDHLECAGAVARLAGALCHYPYRGLSAQILKLDRYASLHARSCQDRGLRPSVAGLILEPPAVFLQRLVLQSGWRDGARGWALAAMAAFYFFLRHARRFEAAWAAPPPTAADAPPSSSSSRSQ
jgi:glycosyltransferase involved in cell wall biosynthesis